MISEESDPDGTFGVKASERTTHAAETIWAAVSGGNATQDIAHGEGELITRIELFDS